jgi:hypothetical protein
MVHASESDSQFTRQEPIHVWTESDSSDKVLTNIHGRLFISLNSERSLNLRAARLSNAFVAEKKTVMLCMTSFSEELDASYEYLPISLEHIHKFYEMITSTLQTYPVSNIVLCTGLSPATQFGTIFLLGSYLILIGMTMCETMRTLMEFEGITSTFECHGLSAFDFWRTLHRSKRMGWIDFAADIPASGDPSFIDIEEYLHYSR